MILFHYIQAMQRALHGTRAYIQRASYTSLFLFNIFLCLWEQISAQTQDMVMIDNSSDVIQGKVIMSIGNRIFEDFDGSFTWTASQTGSKVSEYFGGEGVTTILGPTGKMETIYQVSQFGATFGSWSMPRPPFEIHPPIDDLDNSKHNNGPNKSVLMYKVFCSAILRDNMVTVFGYLLNRPQNPLTTDLYSSLFAIYNYIKLRRITTTDLLHILPQISSVSVEEQFLILFHELHNVIPKYMQSAAEVWIFALENDLIDIKKIIRPDGQALVVDFLASIENTPDLYNLKYPTNFHKHTVNNSLEKIVKLMGTLFSNIFSALSDGSLELTQDLFAAILLHLPMDIITPHKDETERYIVDALRMKEITPWDIIISNISSREFHEPFQLVRTVLHHMSIHALDAEIRYDAYYIIPYIQEPTPTFASPYYKILSPVIGNPVINFQLLLKTITPLEYPPDIVKIRNEIESYIANNYIDMSLVWKGFIRYEYLKPIDVLIAILTRVERRVQKLPEEIKFSIRALQMHLIFKRLLCNLIPALPPNFIFIPYIIESLGIPSMPNEIRIIQKEIVDVLTTLHIDWQSIIKRIPLYECSHPRQCATTIIHILIEEKLISDKLLLENLNIILTWMHREGQVVKYWASKPSNVVQMEHSTNIPLGNNILKLTFDQTTQTDKKVNTITRIDDNIVTTSSPHSNLYSNSYFRGILPKYKENNMNNSKLNLIISLEQDKPTSIHTFANLTQKKISNNTTTQTSVSYTDDNKVNPEITWKKEFTISFPSQKSNKSIKSPTRILPVETTQTRNKYQTNTITSTSNYGYGTILPQIYRQEQQNYNLNLQPWNISSQSKPMSTWSSNQKNLTTSNYQAPSSIVLTNPPIQWFISRNTSPQWSAISNHDVTTASPYWNTISVLDPSKWSSTNSWSSNLNNKWFPTYTTKSKTWDSNKSSIPNENQPQWLSDTSLQHSQNWFPSNSNQLAAWISNSTTSYPTHKIESTWASYTPLWSFSTLSPWITPSPSPHWLINPLWSTPLTYRSTKPAVNTTNGDLSPQWSYNKQMSENPLQFLNLKLSPEIYNPPVNLDFEDLFPNLIEGTFEFILIKPIIEFLRSSTLLNTIGPEIKVEDYHTKITLLQALLIKVLRFQHTHTYEELQTQIKHLLWFLEMQYNLLPFVVVMNFVIPPEDIVYISHPPNPYALGELLPPTSLYSQENLINNQIRSFLVRENILQELHISFSPSIYPTRGLLLQDVLKRALQAPFVQHNFTLYQAIELYLNHLLKTLKPTTIAVDFIKLLDALPPITTINEAEQKNIIIEFLRRTDLAKALNLTFEHRIQEPRGQILKKVFDAALLSNEVRQNPRIFEAFAYFKEKIYLEGFGAQPSEWIIISKETLQRKVNFNSVFKAIDHLNLKGDDKKSYRNVAVFMNRVFNPFVHMNGFNIMAFQTKGEWLRAFLKFLLTNNEVNPSIKQDIERLIYFVHDTGPGAESLENE